MDAATISLLVAQTAGILGVLIERFFNERTRRFEREQDRLDRAESAQRTYEHRELMKDKLEVNTAATVVALEKADQAVIKADALQVSANKIEEQTNGMNNKLIDLARRALELKAEGKKLKELDPPVNFK